MSNGVRKFSGFLNRASRTSTPGARYGEWNLAFKYGNSGLPVFAYATAYGGAAIAKSSTTPAATVTPGRDPIDFQCRRASTIANGSAASTNASAPNFTDIVVPPSAIAR